MFLKFTFGSISVRHFYVTIITKHYFCSVAIGIYRRKNLFIKSVGTGIPRSNIDNNRTIVYGTFQAGTVRGWEAVRET